MEITQKQRILTNGFNEVMKHHLCGNYIDMSAIDGLEYSDIEWCIDINELYERFRMIAFTEFGIYEYNYNYDFDFDSNLNTFVEGLQEFLYNQIA